MTSGMMIGRGRAATSLGIAKRAIGFSTKVRFVKAGHKSLRLFKRRFEGHFDLICRHLYKCLGGDFCLLPNSLHLRLHKLGRNSKRVLKVLRPNSIAL